MVRSHVLIVVPAEVSGLEAGAEVEILFLDGR
jgi:molybdopterin biosynthesis enzyme